MKADDWMSQNPNQLAIALCFLAKDFFACLFFLSYLSEDNEIVIN
jgi:hypothetical protein